MLLVNLLTFWEEKKEKPAKIWSSGIGIKEQNNNFILITFTLQCVKHLYDWLLIFLCVTAIIIMAIIPFTVF